MEIKYKVIDNVDHIFDEKGNTFLALRKISWNDREPKLDLRKWYVNSEGEETVGKGISFLTEDGPNELTRILVKEGYGDTNELMEYLSKREDFDKDKYDIDSLIKKDEYYDAQSLFGDSIMED